MLSELKPRRATTSAALLACCALPLGSCTLAKPVVCAVTLPVYVLAHSDRFCGEPEVLLGGLFVVSAVGAGCGLVTGIISDIQWLAGAKGDPTRNLHDPFATFTSEGQL
jgi:hypothetical protein